MPNQFARSNSRDFAFQSSDQSYAHHLGGGPATTTGPTGLAPQGHDRYDAHQGTDAPSASPAVTHHVHGHGASLSYPDFAPQGAITPQAPGQFPNYGFSPSGPLIWDWNNSIDFSDFSATYEPQGELVQELQNQNVSSNDFSIPLPVTNTDTVYQSTQPLPTATPTTAQKPKSPPPPPPPPKPQRPAVQTGVKRKAESEPSSAISQAASTSENQQGPSKRINKSRSSSTASITSPSVANANEARRSSMTQVSTPAAPEPTVQNSGGDTQRKTEQSKGTGPQGRVIDVSKPRKIAGVPGGHDMLPARKVFPIQIGSELFRLSGASLSSDAPSYFSHFFIEQLHQNGGRADGLRTLYIDRDPETFRDIALHLQGYHIAPRDGEHFVKLFADAQFYSLPRLTKQLFNNDIFIRIGETPFQIPRDLFSAPGDSPNFFSLGFAQWFSTPAEVFPGLDRNALLRPPSISPPKVPNRNGETFADLLRMLQGYNVEIRNETHRSQLLRDARYFHLKGLEQRLIPSEISFNLKTQQSEILIRLEDIRQSGISFTPDQPLGSSNSGSGSAASASGASPAASPVPPLSGSHTRAGFVSYARPYTDDHAHTNILVLEVSGLEHTTLHLPTSPPTASAADLPTLNLRATFHANTLARITSLFSVIAAKMGLPATQPLGLMMLQSGGGVAAQPVSPANSGVSERRVRVQISSDCYMELDGSPVELAVDPYSKRVGVCCSDATRTSKRVPHDHEGEMVPPKSEWIWGGAKSNNVLMKVGEEQEEEWIVKRAHWRIRVEPVEGEQGRMQVVLCGVRIEGYSVEKSRNKARGFLGS